MKCCSESRLAQLYNEKPGENKASLSKLLFISVGCTAGRARSEQTWDGEDFRRAAQPVAFLNTENEKHQ